MKKIFVPASVVFIAFFFLIQSAYSSMLYVDAAPNEYGKPKAYEKWWNKSKRKITKGKFVNMKNGENSDNKGTRNFEVEDTTVYDFKDYGSRLTFIYWLPGETINSLLEDNFKVSVNYFWDEEKYSYTKEAFGSKWVTPTKWEEYKGGVIGAAGVGWDVPEWVENKKDLAEEFAYLDQYQGDIIFKTKRDGQTSSLRANHEPAPVPEPSTVLLFGAAFMGFAGLRLRRKK